MTMPSNESLQLAAQAWCEPEAVHVEMNDRLAIGFARILDRMKASHASLLKAEQEKALKTAEYELIPLDESQRGAAWVPAVITKEDVGDAMDLLRDGERSDEERKVDKKNQYKE